MQYVRRSLYSARVFAVEEGGHKFYILALCSFNHFQLDLYAEFYSNATAAPVKVEVALRKYGALVEAEFGLKACKHTLHTLACRWA